jgi:outer membrane protein assembly factor BamB
VSEGWVGERQARESTTAFLRRHVAVGFEWCINAPVIDVNGVVYANSEDGNIYAINPGGTLRANIFLNQALGAAYTPLAIGPDGTIYTENKGILSAVGK